VFVDTVKPAEDGEGVVVRLYEAHGARGEARLRVGVPFGEAWFANLLEDRLSRAEVSGSEVLVPYRPFEIVTLRLSPPPGTKVPGLAPS
jgi:alpha-mannosidase